MAAVASVRARQSFVAILGLAFLVCAVWELGSFAFHSLAYDSVWARASGKPSATFVYQGLLHSRYDEFTVDYEFKVGDKRYTGHATSEYAPWNGGIWSTIGDRIPCTALRSRRVILCFEGSYG